MLGPGGPALGGGFQVRLPDQRTGRGPSRMLPKLQTRTSTGASRIIIGANGIVYQAADAAYLQQHHYGAMAGQPAAALRHAQSLPPTAFADNMPGTSRDEGHGAGGADMVGEAYPDNDDDEQAYVRSYACTGTSPYADALVCSARLYCSRQRAMRYTAPQTDEVSGTADAGLVKPVSMTTHVPEF